MFSLKKVYLIATFYIFLSKFGFLSALLLIQTDIQPDFTTILNQTKNDKTTMSLKQINNLLTKITNNNYKNTTYFVSSLNAAINELTSQENDKNDIETTKSVKKDVVKKIDNSKYFEEYILKLKKDREQFDKAFEGKDLVKTLTDYLKNRADLDKNINKTLYYESDSEEYFDPANYSDFWKPNMRRVFQGRRTKIKHFPFMASIQIFGRFQCGGSIISSDLVITAASCLQLAWNNRFFRENPRFLSVRVGSTFYQGGGETIPVLEVYFYPTYDPKTLRHNLAITRLSRHLRFHKDNRRHVKKIRVDDNDNKLLVNTDGVLILGWGSRTRSGKTNSPWVDRLSYAILDYYDLRECQEVYTSRYVMGKNFCAGFISKGGGACNRDVGDPGVVHGVLVGVVSFGAPVCGTRDAPTVFTKVGFYYDWIDEIMRMQVPYKKKSTTLQVPRQWSTRSTTTKHTFQPINTPERQTNRETEITHIIDELISQEVSGSRTKETDEDDEDRPSTTKKPEKVSETTMKTSVIDTTLPTKFTTKGPTVGIMDDDERTVGVVVDSDYVYESFEGARMKTGAVTDPNKLKVTDGSDYESNESRDFEHNRAVEDKSGKFDTNKDVKNTTTRVPIFDMEEPTVKGVGKSKNINFITKNAKEFKSRSIRNDAAKRKNIYHETFDLLKDFENVLDDGMSDSESDDYRGLSIEVNQFKDKTNQKEADTSQIPDLEMTYEEESDDDSKNGLALNL